MKHSVSHGLGKEKAKQVADKAMAAYAERFAQYNPTTKWVNDDTANVSFKVKGMTLNGELTVTDKDIEMDLDVPFMLKPFKGKAMGVIEEEIKKWVAKAKAGEV